MSKYGLNIIIAQFHKKKSISTPWKVIGDTYGERVLKSHNFRIKVSSLSQAPKIMERAKEESEGEA